MSRDRDGRRRADRNAFRPALEGRLEERIVMSTARPVAPNTGVISFGRNWGNQYRTGSAGQVGVQTALGGRSVNLVDTDGELYRVNATNGALIQARPTADGRVDLIVTGSNAQTNVVINRMPHPYSKADATKFPQGSVNSDGILHVRNLTIRTGAINQILAYGTADLSGTLLMRNRNRPIATTDVNRIAFYSTSGNARIDVASTINTLDILTSATFSGASSGIYTVGNLNLLNVTGDISFANSASLTIGRDLGGSTQLPKGTGPGGVGALIGGNLLLSNGGRLNVVRYYAAPFVIAGNAIINGNTAAFGPLSLTQNVFAP